MRIHPFFLLCLSLATLLCLILAQKEILFFSLSFFHFILCLTQKLQFKKIMTVFFLACFLSFSFFVMTYTQSNFETALSSYLKISTLSFISLSSVLIIDFEYLILFFMQCRWISPLHAYPFFSAINALQQIKDEKYRLDHLAKMRGVTSKLFFLNQIFPLLVFAIRHSQRSATAMISRGLNENKIFFFDYGLKKKDFFWASFFFGILLSILIFFT